MVRMFVCRNPVPPVTVCTNSAGSQLNVLGENFSVMDGSTVLGLMWSLPVNVKEYLVSMDVCLI